MNRFNKLPIKERKRQAEYRFNQTDRQWDIHEAKIMREDECLKRTARREMSDKERQEEEALLRLKEFAERAK